MAEQFPGGYNGKILRVNLSTGDIASEPLEEKFCREYLGGAGFLTYFLWKELKPHTDPLGPDNKLIFALGPLTGVSVSGGGRHAVGAKSPLTGGIAKCEAGGFWGAELKRAGYDAIIIEGKAEQPCYLSVKDGEAHLHDARHLWGLRTKDAQEKIQEELADQRVRLVSIGPAGENLVLYACIMSGLYSAAGRGGLGAVMGSKNLKAVAVRGSQWPRIAKPDSVKGIRHWFIETLPSNKRIADFGVHGTGAAMRGYEASGNLPVRNFRDGLFPEVTKIDAQAVKATVRTGMESCYACVVRCKKIVQTGDPYNVDPAYGGPEYETLASFGSNCGVDNLEAICKAHEICNANSLDTISAGNVVAFAMECFENGLLTLQDTGGIELRFGNHAAMLQVLELTIRREGIGKLLAEGVARMAKKLGGRAEAMAVHVKGLEAGEHDPRSKPGLGIGYMVNPHGADHCCNMQDTVFVTAEQIKEVRPFGILEPPGVFDFDAKKVALFKLIHTKRVWYDALVACQFIPYDFQQTADLVTAVTGWDTGVMEQLKVAERILTLARMFNIREGFTDVDDVLPARFYQPKTNGALADKPLDPQRMDWAKRYYYVLMGWDARTGVPLPEKLEELNISVPA
jgi:aldehyde:ferredoxin oxidoreductase